MDRYLHITKNSCRLILARGSARCVPEDLFVGVFLFSDVVIVGQKLMRLRKYRTLATIRVDAGFETSRQGLEVTFRNGSSAITVRYSHLANAVAWNQYAWHASTKYRICWLLIFSADVVCILWIILPKMCRITFSVWNKDVMIAETQYPWLSHWTNTKKIRYFTVHLGRFKPLF